MVGMEVFGFAETVADFERVRDQLTPDGDDLVWIVGTNVEYAAYVEFGTSRMQAQPYLQPAAERVARNPGRYIGTVNSIEQMVARVALGIEIEAKRFAPVDTSRLRQSIEAQPLP